MLSMMLVQTQSQSLEVAGGATESVFPLVEAWLEVDSDRWGAFTRIRGKRRMTPYRSVIDFLLCETIPEHRAQCLTFYAGGGAQLRELATPVQLAAMQARLLLFLTLAYEAFTQHRALSWRKAVEMVDEIVSAA